MDQEERKAKIDSCGDGYKQLVGALEGFPKEMWQFRDSHGCWSIHEHIVHITDSEANSYIRCRRFIAEPGESLMAYDENRWAEALDYQLQSPDAALELFRVLRQKSYDLIRNLPAEVWSHGAYHPEHGDMTLDDWLNIYERHIPEHVQYMQENVQEWIKLGR